MYSYREYMKIEITLSPLRMSNRDCYHCPTKPALKIIEFIQYNSEGSFFFSVGKAIFGM